MSANIPKIMSYVACGFLAACGPATRQPDGSFGWSSSSSSSSTTMFTSGVNIEDKVSNGLGQIIGDKNGSKTILATYNPRTGLDEGQKQALESNLVATYPEKPFLWKGIVSGMVDNINSEAGQSVGEARSF